MEHRIRLNLATTALIVVLGIAVSVITSTAVAARAYAQRGELTSRHDQTLAVKGSTRKRIRSDRAVWRIGVHGEKKELADAFETLATGVERVRAFLTKHGFHDDEIGLGAIETTIHYARDPKGNETRDVAAYLLERTYFITTPDVERVSQAAGQVTSLIQDGVLVISNAPAYYYTDLASLKIELMGAASRDARARADEIARNVGGRVAEIRSAQMGVLQVTQPFSTEVSDSGVYNTATIEKDVQAVVSVTFRIES